MLPQRYDLRLRLDPNEPKFSGSVTIPLELAAPRWIVHLHAEELTPSRAVARFAGAEHPLRAELDGHGNLALTADGPFPAGAVTLELAFAGPLAEAPFGVYRAQDGGRWYAFTQLEPLEARRVFPCFDEPGLKVPIGLDLEVPSPMIAVANMPEAGALGVAAEAGDTRTWTRFEFADTPPLPTYLLAFAVGELDLATHPPLSDGRTPFRIVATKDKAALAGFAARMTPRYLAWLERWFGSPYPFPKLDQVAVPSFGSSGMENPGLITYREALLLMDGDRATADDRLWAEAVIAHELAHMWFGDLVTMAWWDDLWLNEAFATFMSRKVLAAVSPDFRIAEGAVRSRFGVMGQDARPGTRAIRQPIVAEGDVYNAFDGITYSKGAAVLAMLETWLGPDAFRAGVRAYLAERAGGSATTADLMRHLSAAAGGLPVERVVASFVDHAGAPSVDVAWRCTPAATAAGGPTPTEVAITLRQRAYRGLGDARPATGPEAHLWAIPVCLVIGTDEAGATPIDACDVLDQPEATWTRELAACPTWIHPNRDEAGYYRWTVAGQALPTRKAGDPPPDPRLAYGALDNERVEVEAGRAAPGHYLDQIVALGRAADLPDILLTALMQGAGLVARALPEGGDDPRYKRLLGELLARQRVALDLGGPEASYEDKLRQPALVRALGGLGDKRVLAEAKRVAEAFLGDVERDTRTARFDLAAHYLVLHVRATGAKPAGAKARDALWKRLRAAFDKARNANERDLLIEALGAFDDPALVLRSYDLLLDGTLRAQDARTLRGVTTGKPAVAEAVWGWLERSFDELVARLGQKAAPGLPGMAGAFCSEADAQRVAAFFESKRAVIPSGLEHNLKNTLDGIRQCALFRTTFGAPIAQWLQKPRR